MFGEDTHYIAKQKLDYEDKKGVIQSIELKDFFIVLVKDFFDEWTHPLTLIAPFISQYNLTTPFTRNQRNLMTFRKALREAIGSSKDKNSV